MKTLISIFFKFIPWLQVPGQCFKRLIASSEWCYRILFPDGISPISEWKHQTPVLYGTGDQFAVCLYQLAVGCFNDRSAGYYFVANR